MQRQRDNYEIAKEKARKRFCTLEQGEIVRRWDLKCDEEWIYVKFLGHLYRISREDAGVWRRERSMDAGQEIYEEAGFEEVLAIFDLLTHRQVRPVAAGRFAPVNSLKGGAKVIGVATEELHSSYAEKLQAETEKFCKACEALGAVRVPLGDIGYEFSVFEDLRLQLKFYYADEEFSAQLICLWDENALSYIYYETAFYIMGHLYDLIGIH